MLKAVVYDVEGSMVVLICLRDARFDNYGGSEIVC
jgi:hypothetical protein